MQFTIFVLSKIDNSLIQIYANAICANAICNLCFRSAMKTQIANHICTFTHFFTAWCNFGMPFGQPLAPAPFFAIDGSVKGEFFSPSSKVRLKTSVVRHNIFTCSGMLL